MPGRTQQRPTTPDTSADTAPDPAARPRFVLWREVLIAYAAPAVMATAGGIATGQSELRIAALTTIAGTSALVATLVGLRHRRRSADSWAARGPIPLRALAFGLGCAVLALAVGLAAAELLPRIPALADSPWPGRLRIDLPLSAAIAATMTTWRWRVSLPRRRRAH
ncbi:hypothetical protein [Streptomyces sp. XY431]|uniref:hypothetical protein n=1 Tax=Streptomyces sp. XY431 TaxID=1415562 RepID=UPI000B094D0E|nr:hypothetical protein [Streptomyces sp. XY431]